MYVKTGDHVKLHATEKNLSKVGFFARKNTSELIDFFLKKICEHLITDGFECVVQNEYKCYVLTVNNHYYSLVSDNEVPKTMAYNICRSLSMKSIDELDLKKEITQDLSKSKISILREDIEKVQKIMEKNIELILTREEKLDDLIKKSDELSESSKMFYRKAEKLNSCCILL